VQGRETPGQEMPAKTVDEARARGPIDGA
jgi:hypothetical protein